MEKFNLGTTSQSMIEVLTEKLKEFNLQPKELNTLNQDLDTKSEDQNLPPNSILVSELPSDNSSEADSDLEEVQANFLELNKLKYEKRRLDHHYYPRPTLAHILYEENDNFISNSYHPNVIYEWNLDGLSEGKHNMLHRMLLYSTVYKQINNIERNICSMITCGFNRYSQKMVG